MTTESLHTTPIQLHPDDFNTTPGTEERLPAVGLYYATPTGHRLVSEVNPLPVNSDGILDKTLPVWSIPASHTSSPSNCSNISPWSIHSSPVGSSRIESRKSGNMAYNFNSHSLLCSCSG